MGAGPVEGSHLPPFAREGIAKMRADEAPRPGYQDRAPSHDIEWLARGDVARNWNKFAGFAAERRIPAGACLSYT